MMKILVTNLLAFLIFISPAFGATENLDEWVDVRMSRFATQGGNYSASNLEDASHYYWWQPDSLCYIDIETGKEVWIITHAPDTQEIYSKEIDNEAWSADGSRIGIFTATGRNSANANVGTVYDCRRVINTDGSGYRVIEGMGRRDQPYIGFGWGMAELATYYTFGSGTGEGGDSTYYKLYKCTLDQYNQSTCELLLDTSGTNSYKKELIGRGIQDGDTWLIARDALSIDARDLGTPNELDCTAVYFIGNDGSPAIDHTWGVARKCGPSPWDDPYGDHEITNEYHMHAGAALASSNPFDTNPVLGINYTGTSVTWIMKMSGSATDGGPAWEDWDGDSFGVNEEIRCISDGAGTPNNPYGLNYQGHPATDRWGHYKLCGDYTDGAKGTRIVDYTTMSYLETYPMHEGFYDGQHHAWAGFTDYVIGVCPATGSGAPEGRYYDIDMNKYDANGGEIQLCSTHCEYTDNYNAYPRPAQSPDGTKIAFATTWLNNSGDDYPYISYVVAYYPYPPEIYSCTAAGGTVTVRFDWGTDSGTWRGYTSRKWPDESTGEYLPPRETSKFRLWRSTDKSTWTPVNTTDANIFTKYDFAAGGYKGGQTSYWNVTDTVGDGTYYYVVTSQEWSGLESRTYSNIYAITVASGSGTGAEDTGYPATPGADANFYSTAPDAPQSVTVSHEGSGVYQLTLTLPVSRTYVRYYNVYALDSSNPTAIQQRRIASIPATADYDSDGVIIQVDWVGDLTGETYYGITSVSYQGDESTITLLGDIPTPENIQGTTFQGVTIN